MMSVAATGGPERDFEPIPPIGDGEPWRLWHLLVAVLAVGLFCWGFMTIGVWAVVLLVIVIAAAVVGKVYVTVRGGYGQRYALLWMLAIAADHRMPMATTVAAFADQYRGLFRTRVRLMAARLAQGAGVAYALRGVGGLASSESELLAEAGEDAGRLGPALRRAASLQASRSAVGSELGSQAAYILVLFLIGQAVVAFLLYFIMPKFEAIFMDFGIGLPAPTVWVVGASHLMMRYLVPLWLPLVTLLLLITVPAALSFGGGLDLPIVGRLMRRRHASLILRALALSAEASRPIEKGLHTLAKRYPTTWARQRLAAAEVEVSRGGDWRDALARVGLIRPADRDVLRSATAVGNLPWAMNDLADAADRRVNLRMTVLTQAVWPIVIVAIALVVLFLAIGFFYPLVELIGRLSG